MISRKTIVTALLLALSSTPVLAKPGQGHPPFPPSYDLNGDGTFTQEEVQSARTTEFGEIDKDDDGLLSFAEAKAWFILQQANEFKKLDADESGSLSKAEFVGNKTGKNARKANKAFKLGDTNKNDSLSLSEFRALKPVNPEIIRLFTMLDTDDDDQISQEEYLTPPEQDQGGEQPGQGGGQPGQGGGQPGQGGGQPGQGGGQPGQGGGQF